MSAPHTDVTEIRPLRIRRPPVFDGPYDDEVGEAPAHVVGSLALALPGLSRAQPRVPLQLVPPAQSADGEDGPLPPLGPIATTLARAVTEVLSGARPPAQLAEHTTFEVLAQLERSAGRFSDQAAPGSRRTPSQAAAHHPRVTSLHVTQPGPRAAELCVVVDLGVRRRAFALRLDGRGTRWRATALQLA